MKIYIIQINDVHDFETFDHEPIAKLTLSEARKELAVLKKDAKKYCESMRYDTVETTKDSFRMYNDGRYGESHYEASISCVDLPVHPRKKGRKTTFWLDVIYGSQASDSAEEIGFRRTRNKLAKGDLEGDSERYGFDTEKDRYLANKMLMDADGWNNNITFFRQTHT